jgi:hypothetical protein
MRGSPRAAPVAFPTLAGCGGAELRSAMSETYPEWRSGFHDGEDAYSFYEGEGMWLKLQWAWSWGK